MGGEMMRNRKRRINAMGCIRTFLECLMVFFGFASCLLLLYGTVEAAAAVLSFVGSVGAWVGITMIRANEISSLAENKGIRIVRKRLKKIA